MTYRPARESMLKRVSPAPAVMDWNDVIALQDAVGSLPSCSIKLSADSPEAQNTRNIIRRTIMEIKSCEIYDSKIDDSPDFSPNADATPTPEPAPGLIVRWNKDTQPFGINVFNALAGRFKAIPGHTMPPNSPPNLIWIQVNGFPWK